MSTYNKIFLHQKWVLLTLVLLWGAVAGYAQQQFVVNLATIDGAPITPDNVFNYSIQSSKSVSAKIKGMIRYRGSGLYLSYTLIQQLHEGVNVVSAGAMSPQWDFSSQSLRNLFQTYHTLPEGTFEYCVSVTVNGSVQENINNVFEECLYHRQDGIFLINLIDPENDAKIHTYNPPLSWVANYAFAGELTYRLRVAEIKKGQNPISAVQRNQPMYDEKNLMQNSTVYPIYAKPLQKNVPYAWTVDAYFNEVLLGGAETWKFTIIDDSDITGMAANRSYIDIRRENGKTKLVFIGSMKLKYYLDKSYSQTLTLSLVNENNEPVKIKPTQLKAVIGDNRYMLNLKDSCNLKHKKDYTLKVSTDKGETFFLPFKYLNPDFAK